MEQPSLLDLDGDDALIEVGEAEPQNQDVVLNRRLQHRTRRLTEKRARSIVWTLVGVFVIIFFVLAFAMLIAHCLAWFLVSKTEARLGDVRKGLLTGGEMKLCLCAT